MFNGLGTLGPDRQVFVNGTDEDGQAQQVDAHRRRRDPGQPGRFPGSSPGSRPVGPVVTSDEFFEIPQVPRRAVVIGGGAIGCEFASTLADLGSEVTILEALPKILPGATTT